MTAGLAVRRQPFEEISRYIEVTTVNQVEP